MTPTGGRDGGLRRAGNAGAAVPLGGHYGLGERSAEVLARRRGWQVYNSKVIVSVVCLLLGANLIGDAIGGLTS